MSNKQKKKRNKVYRGSGAAQVQPAVTRIEAADRNKLQQWWFEKKRVVKPVAIAGGVVIIVTWLIFELVRAL